MYVSVCMHVQASILKRPLYSDLLSYIIKGTLTSENFFCVQAQLEQTPRVYFFF